MAPTYGCQSPKALPLAPFHPHFSLRLHLALLCGLEAVISRAPGPHGSVCCGVSCQALRFKPVPTRRGHLAPHGYAIVQRHRFSATHQSTTPSLSNSQPEGAAVLRCGSLPPAVTECRPPGGLNDGNVLLRSSRARKSQTQVSAGLLSPETSLLGLSPSSRVPTWPLLRAHVLPVSLLIRMPVLSD